MPYTLKLTLYNSAGEVVLDLFDGHAENAPTDLVLTSNVLTSGTGLSGAIGFVFQGALEGYGNGPQNTVYWQGQNNSAQLVGGGTYYAKLEVQDSFGNVRALTQSISVVQVTNRQSLTVYNSAGEAVAHLALGAATGSRLDIKESTEAVDQDPSTGAVTGGFNIDLIQPNGTVTTVPWQGLGDQGQLLSPGSYTVELVTEQSGGATVRESKGIVLLRAPGRDSLSSAVFAPQPWRNDRPLELFFKPLMPGDGVRVNVYNAAAELVLTDYADGSSGHQVLSAGKLASGIYLVELTWVRGQAILQRRVMKLAVVR
jgi:hypothetical protein